METRVKRAVVLLSGGLDSATVLAIGPASSTETQYVADLSLEIPATSAPKVAGYAAADQIAITLTTGNAT